MISFERACDIAYEHFRAKVGIEGISNPCDIGNAWVFNAGKSGDMLVGIQGISVAKEDGAVRAFNLPNSKNFALLENAIKLELSEKYR